MNSDNINHHRTHFADQLFLLIRAPFSFGIKPVAVFIAGLLIFEAPVVRDGGIAEDVLRGRAVMAVSLFLIGRPRRIFSRRGATGGVYIVSAQGRLFGRNDAHDELRELRLGRAS